MDIRPEALYAHLCSDLASTFGEEYVTFCKHSPLPPVGASAKEAACHSIVKSFLKKLRVKNSHDQNVQAANKFLAINLRCKEWQLRLSSSAEEVLFGEFRRAVWDFFNPHGFELDIGTESAFDFGRCGPGASVHAQGGDSYTKLFASPLSCTSQTLYDRYRRYCSRFPLWLQSEVLRMNQFGEATVVRGNRLSFVPKDDKISRSICTEPSLNMFFQLGVGYIFEQQLKKQFGIDLSLQPERNRELAYKGSLGQGYVTIDLSSASDSISLNMLRLVLPSSVMKMLELYRSPVSESPLFGQQELHMVSTMGNGFTFPLQTILFSCVVRAAMRVCDKHIVDSRGERLGNWAVFGDDIICPTSVSRHVIRLLDILGFSVNPDKTFLEGPFRESCGADYHDGINIRGVYVKSLDTAQDRTSVINQLNLFSCRTGIPLRETVRSLLRTVPWIPVPFCENDSSGIKVPRSYAEDLLYDSRLQSVLYTRWEAIGKKLRICDSVISVPRGFKKRYFNPEGLEYSFIAGWINAHTIGVRHDIVKYRRKRVSIPFWDYQPTIRSFERVNWQQWNTAVYFNLIS